MSNFKETMTGVYNNKHKWAYAMLCCCIVLILVAVLFGSMIQTAGWKYKVEDLRNKTNSGKISLVAVDDGDTEAKEYTVSGKVSSGILFTPKKASADDKRPAVIFTHGLYNNREMQLQNAIEMVRRGYVVMVIDHQNHGHYVGASGSFDGVPFMEAAKYLYNLPYVDQGKIAVSCHSMGGSSTNNALLKDGMYE